jgi:hypothetical protein
MAFIEDVMRQKSADGDELAQPSALRNIQLS